MDIRALWAQIHELLLEMQLVVCAVDEVPMAICIHG
jgi:hypothetical protein